MVSRRKIREIMNKYRLISNYTVKQYKVHKSKCNEEKIDNIVQREFTFDRIFNNLEEFKLELRSYVLWYNNKRIHSSLNYMTPVEYRLANMPNKNCINKC